MGPQTQKERNRTNRQIEGEIGGKRSQPDLWSRLSRYIRTSGQTCINQDTPLNSIRKNTASINNIKANINKINDMKNREGSRNRSRIQANHKSEQNSVDIKHYVYTNTILLLCGIQSCIHLSTTHTTSASIINRP